MLQRLYALRTEVATFLRDKDENIPEMSDSKWLSDLAFLVDMTQHLNRLNVLLQGREQLVNSLLDHICAFKVKLRLFDMHLQQNNLYHFPTLAEQPNVDTSAYVAFVGDLCAQFEQRFQEVNTYRKDICYLSSPFDVNINEAPEPLQLELIELQCSEDLKQRFHETPLLQFYQNIFPRNRFPQLAKRAMRILSLFGSTYVCEQLFSKMKFIKSKYRANLTDEHLEGLLRLNSTNTPPNIEKLSLNMQHQRSY
jgi:hypothetical protein